MYTKKVWVRNVAIQFAALKIKIFQNKTAANTRFATMLA
jgi:hypothetical protein